MPVRDILIFPDPRLRRKAEPVRTIDEEIRKTLNDMAETMYAAPGIGLAGPQIGVDKRLVVIDLGDRESDDPEEPDTKRHLYKLINPEIISRKGDTEYEEGCLSIPDVREKVKRSSELIISAKNEKGEDIELAAKGLLAICLQHEIDHLDGVLFIDRLSRLRKQLIKNKLEKLKKSSPHAG